MSHNCWQPSKWNKRRFRRHQQRHQHHNCVALLRKIKKKNRNFIRKMFSISEYFHHSTSRTMICMCLRCCSYFSHNYFTYARTHKIHSIGTQFGKWVHICFCFLFLLICCVLFQLTRLSLPWEITHCLCSMHPHSISFQVNVLVRYGQNTWEKSSSNKSFKTKKQPIYMTWKIWFLWHFPMYISFIIICGSSVEQFNAAEILFG